MPLDIGKPFIGRLTCPTVHLVVNPSNTCSLIISDYTEDGWLYRTSTRAIDRMFSGVKVQSSSIRAGKNVPAPLTSSRRTAISAAVVRTRILVQEQASVRFAGVQKSTYPATAPKSISPETNCPSLPLDFCEREAAAAQYDAMQLPRMQPDPVIFPRISCPFFNNTTDVPSET
jgi:hypothetical protein